MTKRPITASSSHVQRPIWVDTVLDTIKTNGSLLTVFAIALILVSGITLVDNPGNWWVSVLSVLAFCAIVFIFMNARVIIKVLFVGVLTLFLSTWGFQIGSIVEPRTGGGLVWMTSTLFCFFFLMSLSYLMASGVSRWGTIGIATTLGFASAYIMIAFRVPVIWSALLGIPVALMVFSFFYKLTRKTRFKTIDMPTNVLDDTLVETIIRGAELAGWESTVLRDDEESGSVLVWRDRAYLLHPVRMDEAFGTIGRKNDSLGYKGKNINPWLLHLALKKAPLWRARGAQITPVLLDMRNKSGSRDKIRIIGAGLPDTKKKLPVGLIKAKVLLSKNDEKTEDLLSIIDGELSPFVHPISDKQYLALARIGKTNKSDDELDESDNSGYNDSSENDSNMTEEGSLTDD